MRINDDARKAVVFFGVKVATEIEYRGTGFMLCDFEDGVLIPFIVTARHVARALEKYRDEGFYIRVNKKGGGALELLVEEAAWAYHPDSSVDIAVAHLSLSGKLFETIYFPLRDAWFVNEDRIAKYGGPNDVICGDPIAIVGLFRLHRGKQQNVPIVHTGNIAALPHPTEKIPLKDPSTGQIIEVEAYLVESQSLEGLSGAPVFTKQALALSNLGTHYGESPSSYGALVLLGVYVGSWDGDPSEALAREKNFQGRSIRVPIGMGIVIPAQKMVEIIREDAGLISVKRARIAAVKAAEAEAKGTN